MPIPLKFYCNMILPNWKLFSSLYQSKRNIIKINSTKTSSRMCINNIELSAFLSLLCLTDFSFLGKLVLKNFTPINFNKILTNYKPINYYINTFRLIYCITLIFKCTKLILLFFSLVAVADDHHIVVNLRILKLKCLSQVPNILLVAGQIFV